MREMNQSKDYSRKNHGQPVRTGYPSQQPHQEREQITEDTEVRLGSYEMFHRSEPLTETVWEKLMLGLSTRKYGQAVRQPGPLLLTIAAPTPDRPCVRTL
jgi:hypothetical protein